MDKSANEVSITKVLIKKEILNNDIKEFAETAMNELLGWYGYSPRDDSRTTMRSCRSHSDSNSSSPESPKLTESCGWCGKLVEDNTSLCSASAVFCSEACFSQSRRATFKKSKTCDWCRHIRHTVTYVESQDGASQLQFCSDKCLNQYKMHIFCRETRAHLEMHPHFPTENPSGSTLITPELWLKNCRNPENRSQSPRSTPPPQDKPPQTSPLSLITVAHPSKLMPVSPTSPESRRNRKQLKRTRKRCPATITTATKTSNVDLPQDLRIRTSSSDLEHSRSILEEARILPEQAHASNGRVDNNIFKQNKISEPECPNSQYFRATETPVPPRLTPPPLHAQRSMDFIPPPTVLVPYPLVLPLPIPIPVPIPMRSLLPEDIQKDKSKFKDASTQTDSVTEENTCTSHDDNIEVNVENDEEEAPKPPRKRRRMIERPKPISKNKSSK